MARNLAGPYPSAIMDIAAFRGSGPGALLLGAALLTSMVAGCGNSDQTKKQVGALEKQLTAMRADQDRLEERLSVLEIDSRKQDDRARREPAAADERLSRPRLKVIHMGPDDAPPGEPAQAEPEPAPAEPGAERPVIRGTGDRVIKMYDAAAQGGSSAGKRHAEDPRRAVKD